MQLIRQLGRWQAPSYKGRRSNGIIVPAAVGGVALLLALVLFFLPGVRFSACLFLGVSCLSAVWLILRRWSEISIYGKVCKWIFLVGVTALATVLLVLEILVVSESSGDSSDTPVSAVIVLGAGVNGDRPSLSLQTRIEAAADYLKEHPETPAVLTGGQGSGEQISEAEAMYRGLIALGVAGERLLMEKQATNTAQNFAYSAEVLADHGIAKSDPVAVISNDFHLFRAKLIAKRAGFSDPVCIPAELPWWLGANYYVREAFASVKTLLFD